jgi:ABC-type multidrug transport system fused ATPase/permease subunit
LASRANQIVVLEGGRVAEKGTHDVLLRCGGRYARLYELQSTSVDQNDASSVNVA